ncbi:MAG: flagellar biosynthesis protein FlhF [Rubrivivax sp.]
MTPRRFSARTSREAFALVREAFGEDAVVLSTRPCAQGVEVMAMAADAVPPTPSPALRGDARQSTANAAPMPAMRHPVLPSLRGAEIEAPQPTSVEQDVATLSMSTLSFQDYVRERMLRRRQAEKQGRDQQQADVDAATTRAADLAALPPAPASVALRERAAGRPVAPAAAAVAAVAAVAPAARNIDFADTVPPMLHDGIAAPLQSSLHTSMHTPTQHAPQALSASGASVPVFNDAPLARRGAVSADNTDMLDELRAMRGLIEDRFGALAFMEKLQREPRQAQLTQALLDQGFSPVLTRKLADSLPAEGEPLNWAAGVLERNLHTSQGEAALEDTGGVFALIGATGVGKTTSTAKLAAAFATRHGAAHLGLITLDAYRVAAHEQLRAYGRILGVPVHTAHDRASLEDLLELLAGKKMVLIDTAGMAQRDARTRELLDMLSHRSINRLLVINAAAQGETIEDVLHAYRASSCRGVILSKLDEAVKLGPALDAMVRHKLKVLAVANGQRVPEDWHRLSSNALVQQALRAAPAGAWRMEASDIKLVFAGMRAMPLTTAPTATTALHA